MRHVIALLLLLLIGVVALVTLDEAAQANLAPYEPPPAASSPADLAPRNQRGGRNLGGRLFSRAAAGRCGDRRIFLPAAMLIFDKTRLAQACH